MIFAEPQINTQSGQQFFGDSLRLMVPQRLEPRHGSDPLARLADMPLCNCNGVSRAGIPFDWITWPRGVVPHNRPVGSALIEVGI